MKTEADLNHRLGVAMLANSPDVASINAEHEAVLRQLADVQDRILQLETAQPPTSSPCSAA